jgi:NADPH2 dehydrogenase
MINVWGKTSPVILTGGFNAQSAKRVVDEEYKDKDIIIGFGRYFISNPDIVFRIREGIELTPFEQKKFYNKGEKDGYITYKNSEAFDTARLVEVVS